MDHRVSHSRDNSIWLENERAYNVETMPKKRPPKYLQEYHGQAADPDWWRTALKRHKKGEVFQGKQTAEGFSSLIEAYLTGEIPAAIFGVTFLKAFEQREDLSPRIEDLLWGVNGLVRRLPGFDEYDDVNELSESEVKAKLTSLPGELRWALEQERRPTPPTG